MTNLANFDDCSDFDLSIEDEVDISPRLISRNRAGQQCKVDNKFLKQRTLRKPGRKLLGSLSSETGKGELKPSFSLDHKVIPEQTGGMSGDVKQLLDRIRTKANIDVPLDEYGMVSGDHVNHTDPKRLSSTAEVHMMKVKLRMQENEVDKMAKEAAMNLQDSGRATAQIEVLVKNIKNCKAYDLHQNQKLQGCLKQIADVRKQNAQLEKEVDKLKREMVTMGKDEEKNKLSVAIPELNSASRLTAINEGLKEETLQVKEDNKRLQESNRKVQQSLLDARRKDQLECKRFIALIHKLEILLEHTRKEREHLEGVCSLQFNETDLRRFFECSKG